MEIEFSMEKVNADVFLPEPKLSADDLFSAVRARELEVLTFCGVLTGNEHV